MSWGLHKFGQDYDAWPKGPDGEPEEPAFLANCTQLDMQSDMTRNMLGAYGIPSFSRYPGDGAFGKVMLGMSGSGVDIYVPKSRLEEAQALLKGVSENDGSQEGI